MDYGLYYGTSQMLCATCVDLQSHFRLYKTQEPEGQGQIVKQLILLGALQHILLYVFKLANLLGRK